MFIRIFNDNDEVTFLGNFPNGKISNLNYFWESFFWNFDVKNNFSVYVSHNGNDVKVSYTYGKVYWKVNITNPNGNETFTYNLKEGFFEIPIRDAILLVLNDWNIESIADKEVQL